MHTTWRFLFQRFFKNVLCVICKVVYYVNMNWNIYYDTAYPSWLPLSSLELLYQLWEACVQQTTQRLNFVQHFPNSYNCKLCFSRVWGWIITRYCCFNAPVTWVYKEWGVNRRWLLKINLLQCVVEFKVQIYTITSNVKTPTNFLVNLLVYELPYFFFLGVVVLGKLISQFTY